MSYRRSSQSCIFATKKTTLEDCNQQVCEREHLITLEQKHITPEECHAFEQGCQQFLPLYIIQASVQSPAVYDNILWMTHC